MAQPCSRVSLLVVCLVPTPAPTRRHRLLFRGRSYALSLRPHSGRRSSHVSLLRDPSSSAPNRCILAENAAFIVRLTASLSQRISVVASLETFRDVDVCMTSHAFTKNTHQPRQNARLMSFCRLWKVIILSCKPVLWRRTWRLLEVGGLSWVVSNL